jgi:hypothetical protein
MLPQEHLTRSYLEPFYIFFDMHYPQMILLQSKNVNYFGPSLNYWHLMYDGIDDIAIRIFYN